MALLLFGFLCADGSVQREEEITLTVCLFLWASLSSMMCAHFSLPLCGPLFARWLSTVKRGSCWDILSVLLSFPSITIIVKTLWDQQNRQKPVDSYFFLLRKSLFRNTSKWSKYLTLQPQMKSLTWSRVSCSPTSGAAGDLLCRIRKLRWEMSVGRWKMAVEVTECHDGRGNVRALVQCMRLIWSSITVSSWSFFKPCW